MKAAVLGTGIAGLSIAEVLSRNGWDIELRDVNPFIGGDASLATQNWYHTGWLYAAMPNDAPFQGCAKSVDLLGRHYRGFQTDEWIRARDTLFLYAIQGHELNLPERMAWQGYVRTVVFPRLKGWGLQGERIDPPPAIRDLMRSWEQHPKGEDRYWTMRSTDREIDTRLVMTDLADRITGRAILGQEPNLASDGLTTTVDGHHFDLVVLASGSSIPGQLERIGQPDIARKVTSVVAPVCVLREPLDVPSFIRYTPNVQHTVNHMRFRDNGEDLSTIGGYDYWPVTEMRSPQPFAEKVCRMLNLDPSTVARTYHATKTEYTDGRDRRWNHAVVRANMNTLVTVPGKFSQFPLLARDVALMLGLDPALPPKDGNMVAPIGPLRASAPEGVLL